MLVAGVFFLELIMRLVVKKYEVASPRGANKNYVDGFRYFVTLSETNSSPLKMDAWNTIASFWGKRPIFRGNLLLVDVSCREGTFLPLGMMIQFDYIAIFVQMGVFTHQPRKGWRSLGDWPDALSIIQGA